MKIKHLLIVGLLFAIITVGAVSASENITSDDLAVEDATEDSIEVADDSAIEIADEQEEESAGNPTDQEPVDGALVQAACLDVV
jgi:hypothetical protein